MSLLFCDLSLTFSYSPSGFLRATQKAANDSSGLSLNILCSDCHRGKCWFCLNQHHPTLSCAEVKQVRNRWMGFLHSMVNKEDSPTSGDGLAQSLTKFEQQLADNEYFATNILNGNMKRCPKCKRLIEKMQGCDSMVCGRNAEGGNVQRGCGHSFSWGSVKKLTIEEIEVHQSSLTTVNISDPHYISPGSSSMFKCTECRKNIIGSRFCCINCTDDTSICISCVKNHIIQNGDGNQRHKDHVFDIVDPPLHPLKKASIELKDIISRKTLTSSMLLGPIDSFKVLNSSIPQLMRSEWCEVLASLLHEVSVWDENVEKGSSESQSEEHLELVHTSFVLLSSVLESNDSDFKKAFVASAGFASFHDIIRKMFWNNALIEKSCDIWSMLELSSSSGLVGLMVHTYRHYCEKLMNEKLMDSLPLLRRLSELILKIISDTKVVSATNEPSSLTAPTLLPEFKVVAVSDVASFLTALTQLIEVKGSEDILVHSLSCILSVCVLPSFKELTEYAKCVEGVIAFLTNESIPSAVLELILEIITKDSSSVKAMLDLHTIFSSMTWEQCLTKSSNKTIESLFRGVLDICDFQNIEHVRVVVNLTKSVLSNYLNSENVSTRTSGGKWENTVASISLALRKKPENTEVVHTLLLLLSHIQLYTNNFVVESALGLGLASTSLHAIDDVINAVVDCMEQHYKDEQIVTVGLHIYHRNTVIDDKTSAKFSSIKGDSLLIGLLTHYRDNDRVQLEILRIICNLSEESIFFILAIERSDIVSHCVDVLTHRKELTKVMVVFHLRLLLEVTKRISIEERSWNVLIDIFRDDLHDFKQCLKQSNQTKRSVNHIYSLSEESSKNVVDIQYDLLQLFTLCPTPEFKLPVSLGSPAHDITFKGDIFFVDNRANVCVRKAVGGNEWTTPFSINNLRRSLSFDTVLDVRERLCIRWILQIIRSLTTRTPLLPRAELKSLVPLCAQYLDLLQWKHEMEYPECLECLRIIGSDLLTMSMSDITNFSSQVSLVKMCKTIVNMFVEISKVTNTSKCTIGVTLTPPTSEYINQMEFEIVKVLLIFVKLGVGRPILIHTVRQLAEKLRYLRAKHRVSFSNSVMIR